MYHPERQFLELPSNPCKKDQDWRAWLSILTQSRGIRSKQFQLGWIHPGRNPFNPGLWSRGNVLRLKQFVLAGTLKLCFRFPGCGSSLSSGWQGFAWPDQPSFRQSRQSGNLYAKRSFGCPGSDLPNEDDFIVPFLYCYGIIFEPRKTVRQSGQFMIMSANKVLGPSLSFPCKCSTTAQAMLNPS